jgi:N-acyl-D-aspartate/D-glutamate deacylase
MADIVVFDPTTVAALPNERVWDFPADGDRLVSRSTGITHVWVNGVQTWQDGRPVEGSHPGQVLRRAAP